MLHGRIRTHVFAGQLKYKALCTPESRCVTTRTECEQRAYMWGKQTDQNNDGRISYEEARMFVYKNLCSICSLATVGLFEGIIATRYYGYVNLVSAVCDILPRDILPRDILPCDILPRDILPCDILPCDLLLLLPCDILPCDICKLF